MLPTIGVCLAFIFPLTVGAFPEACGSTIVTLASTLHHPPLAQIPGQLHSCVAVLHAMPHDMRPR